MNHGGGRAIGDELRPVRVNGRVLYGAALTKGAEGSWFTHSPQGVSYMGRFQIFEPSEGCIVRGIWLAPGRESELAQPVDAKSLNEIMLQNYGPVWTDPRLLPRSLVTVLLTGTAEAVSATFSSDPPRMVSL